MKTTGTQFLRFSKQADAQAYATATNAHSQTASKMPFAASWYPREDTESMWCAPFYGPPYTEEPANIAKLRTDAEMVDALYWPEE